MHLRPESAVAALQAAAQALAFGIGAWLGYDFGIRIGGLLLGLLAALNTGTLAAVFAGAALEPLRRVKGRPRTSSSTSGAGRRPGSR